MSSAASSSRPRRSTRQTVQNEKSKSSSSQSSTRKQEPKPGYDLDFLLKNPKSPLTKLDMATLLNAETWRMLSPESRANLSSLLPKTAFHGYEPSLEPNHPSLMPSSSEDMAEDDRRAGTSTADPQTQPSPDMVDTAVFTDLHFLAAMHTFQDHLYSNWFSSTYAEKVRKFEQGARDGTLAAPWKDETWERENPPNELDAEADVQMQSLSQPQSNARAGEAAELKLTTLARNSVLFVGDIIAYKRNFSYMDLVIEKDAIIESIHPKTGALTVLVEPGPTQSLPRALLLPQPLEPPPQTQSMVITSPSMLETVLLDVDGRIDRSRRPNGNAWKAFTIWRWSENPPSYVGNDERAGRVNHGTLFYLRACHYQEIL